MLIAVNYHYVRPTFDTPYPGIQGVTTLQFEEQLCRLRRSGRFVSLADVREAARRGVRLPDRALLITFDDGLREQFEHAWPVLRRLGIPAAFFVNSAPVADGQVMTVHKIHLLRSHVPPHDFERKVRCLAREWSIAVATAAPLAQVAAQYPYDAPDIGALKYLLNFQLSLVDQRRIIETCFGDLFQSPENEVSLRFYMDKSQLHELTKNGCIGSHSHDHLPLGLLPSEEAAHQLLVSAIRLEEWTGTRPFALSYPYGMRNSTSVEVQSVAAKLGFEMAFTMERGRNDDFAQPLSLARFDCNDAPGGKACTWEPEEFFDRALPAQWYRPK